MTNFTLTTASDNFSGAGNANDTFAGPAGGTDTLNGGGGNDLFTFESSENAFVDGGTGNDTIMMSTSGFNNSLSFVSIVNVETLVATTTNFSAPIAQLNAFQTIVPGAGGTQFAIFLSGAGGTLDFSSRYHSSTLLQVEASSLTSSSHLIGTTHGDFFFASSHGDNLSGGGGNDTLNGNSGADSLAGGTGSDSMTGFGGNDQYVVDGLGDQTIEQSGGGTDTVFTSASYHLGAGQSIELFATTSRAGTGAINLTGNELAQRIDGNNGANTLNGGGGADSLYGFDGNDTLIGGAGHDTLTPGNGADIVRFLAVAESSSVNYDIVVGMNLNSTDKFDTTFLPAAIDATVAHGVLRSDHFDSDLAAALMGHLGAHHAILFTPDDPASDLKGHTFLIVDDGNTVPTSYQANADYVIDITGFAGTLTVDDFV